MPFPKNTSKIFHTKYKKLDNGCWEWQNGVDKDGYGIFKYDNGTRAHRYSYMIRKGKIPKGKCICHKCDNPRCVNPEHLWLGTRLENNLDMLKKGRWCDRKGEKHPLSKLSNEQTEEIRNIWRKGKFSQSQIGSMYDIHQCNVSRIVNGKRRALTFIT